VGRYRGARFAVTANRAGSTATGREKLRGNKITFSIARLYMHKMSFAPVFLNQGCRSEIWLDCWKRVATSSEKLCNATVRYSEGCQCNALMCFAILLFLRKGKLAGETGRPIRT
jgi:hypothetical protein